MKKDGSVRVCLFKINTPILSRLFLRKPVNLQQSGRSSDLLIISNLPIPTAGTVAYNTNELIELTATGIVSDFHRIPFSSDLVTDRNLTLKKDSLYLRFIQDEIASNFGSIENKYPLFFKIQG